MAYLSLRHHFVVLNILQYTLHVNSKYIHRQIRHLIPPIILIIPVLEMVHMCNQKEQVHSTKIFSQMQRWWMQTSWLLPLKLHKPLNLTAHHSNYRRQLNKIDHNNKHCHMHVTYFLDIIEKLFNLMWGMMSIGSLSHRPTLITTSIVLWRVWNLFHEENAAFWAGHEPKTSVT